MPSALASRGLAMATGLTVDQDLAGVGGMRARQHAHQRALAGAVAADQSNHFARVQVDGDVVDGVHAAERHADIAQLDQRRRLG